MSDGHGQQTVSCDSKPRQIWKTAKVVAGVWFLEFAAWQFLTTYVTLGWLLKGSPPDNRATTVREPQGG